jgi:hypothetical protein
MFIKLRMTFLGHDTLKNFQREYSAFAGTLQWSMKSRKNVHIKYTDERPGNIDM